MNQEQFITELRRLSGEAKSSGDPMLVRSAGVLQSLVGSLLAGEEFFTAFADRLTEVNRNMMEALLRVMGR